MPLPWPSSLLPEAAIAGLVAAVGAGAVGGFVGGALARLARRSRGRARAPAPAAAALAGLLALVAVVAWGLPISSDGPQRAAVTLTDVPSPRRAQRPGDRPRDPERRARRRPLRQRDRLAGRRQRGQRPASGSGRASTAPPSRSRSTTAGRRWCACTPAARWWACRSTCRATGPSRRPRCPPWPSFTRPFERDVKILQREQKEDVPGALKLDRLSDGGPDRRRAGRA